MRRPANELWKNLQVKLCKFSIDDQGVDAISSKRWDFFKEVDRVKFLEDVDRRGPPLLWVHCQSRRTS